MFSFSKSARLLLLLFGAGDII